MLSASIGKSDNRGGEGTSEIRRVIVSRHILEDWETRRSQEMKPTDLMIRAFNMEDYDRVIALWDDAKLPYRPKGRDSAVGLNKSLTKGILSSWLLR